MGELSNHLQRKLLKSLSIIFHIPYLKESQFMKIVTDCAADIPAEERKNLDIVEAPLFIQFPEGEINSADLSLTNSITD